MGARRRWASAAIVTLSCTAGPHRASRPPTAALSSWRSPSARLHSPGGYAMRLFATVIVALGIIALAAGPASAAPAKTLDNLMAAFNGESNANAKYLEYAKKADAEGYAGAAGLFRAAAKAEATHAATHAAVIKKLGGTPKGRHQAARDQGDSGQPEGGARGRELRARQDVPRVHRRGEGVGEQGRAPRVQLRDRGRRRARQALRGRRREPAGVEDREDVLRLPRMRQDRRRSGCRQVPGVLHARRQVRQGQSSGGSRHEKGHRCCRHGRGWTGSIPS